MMDWVKNALDNKTKDQQAREVIFKNVVFQIII